MSILAFHPPHLKSIPQGVHVILHPADAMPGRDAIVAALPRTEQDTPQLHYDTLWIGGGHGDVDNHGAPTQFNGCCDVAMFQRFIADLVAIGIRTPALIVDTCFRWPRCRNWPHCSPSTACSPAGRASATAVASNR